jgi:hypothetical protein
MGMKKTSILIGAMLVSFIATPVQATESPTVAIIDSGFDTSVINNIVAEACILTLKSGCNNGSGFQEGLGSASSVIPIRANWVSEWKHGTKMASIVNQINPNARLILIRNAAVIPSGSVNIGGEKDFNLALDWVIKNKAKYNISAVSFSRGSNTVTKSGTCPINKDIQAKIVSLQNLGTATVIAAGNNGDKVNVSYPACIPEAIAISGIYSQDYTPGIWSSYRQTRGTNSGLLTDFFAYGNFKTPAGAVAESTSSSTAAFAGYWSRVSNGNYFETYEKLSKSTSNKYINVLN